MLSKYRALTSVGAESMITPFMRELIPSRFCYRESLSRLSIHALPYRIGANVTKGLSIKVIAVGAESVENDRPLIRLLQLFDLLYKLHALLLHSPDHRSVMFVCVRQAIGHRIGST